MAERNEAAYLTAVGHIDIREAPMPVPGEGELLLAVKAVGVCGSDVHFYQTGMRKGKAFALPFILGHECAAEVVAVGPGARGFAPGDLVTIEPQITCGHCDHCRAGRYNLCDSVVFPSVPPHDGLLRRYVALPARQAHRLPPGIGPLEGALVEPLAVGFSAAERGGVTPGKTVAILGCGCIGLTTLLACKAYGATRVLVSDLIPARGQKALELGASQFIDAAGEDAEQRFLEATGGQGADIVFETAGSKTTARQTAAILKRGGVIVLVGNINGLTEYPFMDLMYKEGIIRTIYRYKNNFPTVISSIAECVSPVAEIVSSTYPFADTQRAFEDAANNPQSMTKAVIIL